MNKPKISIITITFNSEKTVEETINSIVSQNYSNLEYIIIDGGSTDSTLEIVNKYRDKISKIISEKDEGISDAFNKGIRLATGDLIGIINSDDILLPDALLRIAQEFELTIDVYRGNTILWNDKLNTKNREIPSMRFPIPPFFLNVCHQSTFINKQAYLKYGNYKTDFKYLMDADLLTRFYRRNAVFKYINFDVAKYRTGGVTSQSITKKKHEMYKFIIDNGGSKIDFLKYYVLKFSIYHIKIFFSIFRPTFPQKIRLLFFNKY